MTASHHESQPNADLSLLIEQLAEVIAEGRLAGNFQDHVILANEDLVAAWRRIASNQPVSSFEDDDGLRPCIVFAVDDHSRLRLLALRDSHPNRITFDFFEQYLPSLMARTFTPSRWVPPDQIGTGIVIFHTPRTGSHFLMSMVASCGDFGETEEWIRPAVVTAVRLNIVGLVEHMQRCAGYQRAFSEHWSLKIEIPFLFDMWSFLDKTERKRFQTLISTSHSFLLSRNNATAQILSTIRAVSTGQFVKTSSASVESISTHILTDGSVDRYWFWNAFARDQIKDWEEFVRYSFSSHNQNIKTVYYEDLMQNNISEDVQLKVFGPFHNPTRYALKIDSSKYQKQSGNGDLLLIGKLEVTNSTRIGTSFRVSENLSISRLFITSGRCLIDKNGVSIENGVVTIFFDSSIHSATTGVLQFEIGGASCILGYSIRVFASSKIVFEETISIAGGYVLFFDPTSTDGIINVTIDTTRSLVVPLGQIMLTLVRLIQNYTVDVSYDCKPYFPWMERVSETEFAALHYLGTLNKSLS